MFFTTKETSKTNIPDIPGHLLEDVIFFDIETTGFSPEKSSLYLIGCLYYRNNKQYTIQWFAEHPLDEADVITAFLEFIKNYKALIHYNGNGFDIPYLIRKCAYYNISFDFRELESIDIYKLILPFKKLFKTENIKQKTMEKFIGVKRSDKYSGGELINVYTEYTKHPNEEMKELLLLHNSDDIQGMVNLLPLLNYRVLTDKAYTLDSFEITSDDYKKELFITLKSSRNIPVRVSNGFDSYYFTAYGDTIKICVKVYTQELKYFYPDYQNYYYLPKEDYAVHKSVSFYVDKNFRTKAKAANCYSRKTGLFLPQYEEIFSPYFKIDYYDKVTYFECTDEFRNSPEQILKYCNHIFNKILR